MPATVPFEQIDRIVWNQHHDPFEVLCPHALRRKWQKTLGRPSLSAECGCGIGGCAGGQDRIPDEIRASPSFF